MNRRVALMVSVVTMLGIGAPVAASPAGAAGNACRGDNLKPKLQSEVARRESTLAALVAALQPRRDPYSLNGGQVATLQSAEPGLRTLGAQVQATCYPTLAAFRADATKVFADYRVYWLRVPQTHALEAADRLAEVHDSLAKVATKLGNLVGGNADAQHDLATMNNALAAAQTSLGTPPNAASSIAAAAGLQPAADMTANENALRAAHTDLATAHNDLVQARGAARNVIADLKKALK